jgi:hypothetical protein
MEAEPGVAPSLERPRERASPRTITMDFSYVTKDVRRVVILATAVIVTLVVLSFFLP